MDWRSRANAADDRISGFSSISPWRKNYFSLVKIWGLRMNPRLQLTLGSLLLFTFTCARSEPAKEPLSTAKSGNSHVKTATSFSDASIIGMTEDEASAAPAEALARTAGAALVGTPALVASMKTIDGQSIDLGKNYGKKPVYIKLWATWCAPCRQQMPAFEKLYETMGDKIQFIALNIGLSDDLDSIKAMRKKYAMKMPIVVDDGRFAQQFNLRVTPQRVLIGRDGRFAYFGHTDSKELSDAVQRVLEQPPSTVPLHVASPDQHPFRPGDLVGALSATTLAGHRVSLAASSPGRLRGVVFFSSWCEWYLGKTRPSTSKACARTRRDVEAMAEKNDGIDWVGVAGGPWSTAEDLRDYQKANKITIPLALDESGSLFRAFGIHDIPTIQAKGALTKWA
jgi:thiol-disulfide isomerase/thioredoxin